MKLGIDIGSVTAKAVVLDEADNIIEARYTRTRGQPVETILAILEDMLSKYSPDQFKVTAATGTGGELIARLLGVPSINEITAQASGTTRFHPEVPLFRSIVFIHEVQKTKAGIEIQMLVRIVPQYKEPEHLWGGHLQHACSAHHDARRR